MTHRDANNEIMDRTWQAVWDAIDLCPDNPGGRELRRLLVDRASAHLAVARADFAAQHRDPASYLAEHPELASHVATLYAQTDVRLCAMAEVPQIGFGDDGPFSLN